LFTKKKAGITIRRALAADGQKIGAVFNATVCEEWKYLGELVSRPTFPPEEWDKLPDGTSASGSAAAHFG